MGIIEEVLTKKPFVKHLLTVLLEGSISSDLDLVKITRECLKNLTAEDFMQLAQRDLQSMLDYERKYFDIQGTDFENELAKIMLRFGNEGRPENLAP